MVSRVESERAMPEYRIDFSITEVYEAGATLIALLAYPADTKDDAHRADLHHSLCALALRARAQVDEKWAHSPQHIKPSYALRSDGEIAKDLRTLERRLRDRMIAGQMAVPFLQKASTGRAPRLPRGVERLSINQLSEMVLRQSGHADPENVESRVWRPSLPVIHLAAAIQVLIQVLERSGSRAVHIGDFMTNRGIIEWVVREAKAYEPLISQSPKLSSTSKSLVRLRLIDK